MNAFLTALSLVLAATLLAAAVQDPVRPATSGLVYRFDVEGAIARGELSAKTAPEEVMAACVELLRRRVAGSGVESVVSRRGAREVVVELPGMSEAHLRAFRARIETSARLEMRIVATDGNADGFELAREKARLEDWLANDDHRRSIATDPRRIDLYHRLTTAQGGRLAQRHLRWYPRKIREDRRRPGTWEYCYALDPREAAMHAVAAFTARQYAGPVPAKTEPDAEEPFLVEFLPIDPRQTGFDGGDIDPGVARAGTDPASGLPCVFFEIAAARKADYADWSSDNLGEKLAFLVDGIVVSAPTIQGRLYGTGMITGALSAREASDLAAALGSPPYPVAPALVEERR